MASDIISALNLDKESPKGCVYVVKETNGCEGSFITSCILGHQVKKKSATLFVTLHQLLDHYHNVGLRMGYNLKNQQSAGLLRVISPAEQFLTALLRGEPLENFLKTVLATIQNNITDLVKEHSSKGPVCVYIDGLTHLFDLGYSLSMVNAFSRSVIEIVRENECFVVVSCTAGSDQDNGAVLASLLGHVSHCMLEVESLASGRSADVSGHLAVRRPALRFDRVTRAANVAPTRYHFRLFDRGVKLYAPGAVGV